MKRLDIDDTDAVPHLTGTALLTALVLLLVLTLLGTFAMQQSRLEAHMAGNTQFQIQALANAEYVLAAGEADVLALHGDPFSPDRPGDHYYPQDTVDFNPAVAGRQTPADRAWAFNSARVSLPDIDGDGSDSDGDGIADDGTGRYVIQDAGLELTLTGHAGDGNDPAAQAGTAVQAFLVTAHSRTSGGAQRTVQSVYVRTPLPGRGAPPRAPRPAGAASSDPPAGLGRRSWIDLRP